MYHVTKQMLIVLMNAPFGTIALGASLHRPSIVKWHHCHQSVVQLGTIAAIAVVLPLDLPLFFGVHPLPLGSTSLSADPELGKTFKVDYGAWRPSVPSGAKVLQ